MPLTAGARLGPYELLSPLGAGGMGEVYRARDTRLDRVVAIKVLRAQRFITINIAERATLHAEGTHSDRLPDGMCFAMTM